MVWLIRLLHIQLTITEDPRNEGIDVLGKINENK